MSDEDDIKAFLKSYYKAVHDKDATALAALYADDAVLFEQAPPLLQKASKVKNPDFWNHWFITWTSPIDVEFRDTMLKIDGNLAVTYSLGNMKGTRTTGAATDEWFRTTMVLSKETGKWLVLHTHNSVPFAMDGSFKALIDLKPE